MQLVYVGPFRPGVVIPALDELEVVAGVPFEVENDGVAAQLIEQGTFEPAVPAKPAKPAKGVDPASAEED